MTEPRVKLEHIRALRYCMSGAREWCARYGLSWEQLRREGIPCSTMEATGDAFGIAAAAFARGGGSGQP